jgi:hypothetical protein
MHQETDAGTPNCGWERQMIKVIKRTWSSPSFERITHRIGASLLLLSNLALPLGLHRPFMRLPGYWLFPLAFAGAAIGSLNYLNSFNHYWLLLVWPYSLLFTADAWIIWLTPIRSSAQPDRSKD